MGGWIVWYVWRRNDSEKVGQLFSQTEVGSGITAGNDQKAGKGPQGDTGGELLIGGANKMRVLLSQQMNQSAWSKEAEFQKIVKNLKLHWLYFTVLKTNNVNFYID